MSEHDCLNNEDQLDSVLDEVAQIDSEFDSVDDIDSDLEKVVEVIRNNIESISVNGDNIEPDENKNVNIEIPTTTSGFENDGDGISPFATEKYVELYGGKIDSISIDGVNQTIDENKNVNLKGLASTEFVEGKIQKLIGLAPETLDTLEEIANELGENAGAINSLNNTIKEKADKTALEETNSAVKSNADAIEELRNSSGKYSAGEGLSLDADNNFSIVPANERYFGGLRVWEDDEGYLCFATADWVAFKNKFKNGTLQISGSYIATLNDGNLVLE